MASKRKYAYYLKGKNIAIIEENIGSGVCSLSGYSNQTTCEAAGGTWTENAFNSEDSQYKSPVSTIEGGLEIQYAYSPIFNLQSAGQEGSDFHRFLGWGSDGTNLVLFTYKDSIVYDISGVFAADDWIYVSGSGRWSGLHQVKSSGTKGVLTLKTKCNLKPSRLGNIVGSFAAATKTFNGDSTSHDMDIEAFKDAQAYRSTSYIFLRDAEDAVNNGLFSLTSDTTSGQLTFNDKITISDTGDYTVTAAATADESADTINIHNAFYEQISVYEDVEVMQGESVETFELDLSRYQANALVYYLKAKLAEDAADFDSREYFMREFKRQLEKSTSALKRGPYMVQGFKEMT